MGRTKYEDTVQYGWAQKDKKNLRSLAGKINNIPKEFSKVDGSLDLDKIHLKLMDYHKK